MTGSKGAQAAATGTVARHEAIDSSPRLLPVDVQVQLVPATFKHAPDHLGTGHRVPTQDAGYTTASESLLRRNRSASPFGGIRHREDPLLLLRTPPKGIKSVRAISRSCRKNWIEILLYAMTGSKGRRARETGIMMARHEAIYASAQLLPVNPQA
jgi:hypothetical protein